MTISLADMVKYVTDIPEKYEPNKPYYILRSDGVYRHTLRDAILVKECFSRLSKNLPILKAGEEGLEYILPKVPLNVYLTILDFYKAVHAKDRTEASCHLFYLSEDEVANFAVPAHLKSHEVGVHFMGQWLLYCPQQVNSGTLTSFREDRLYPYLRKQYVIAMETHSHHTMDAFWSGTDNANQQDPILYGVFGQINKADNFLMKFVLGGKNIDIATDTIIEYPKYVAAIEPAHAHLVSHVATDLGVYKGAFQASHNFPTEWLTECHTVAWEGDTGRRGRLETARGALRNSGELLEKERAAENQGTPKEEFRNEALKETEKTEAAHNGTPKAEHNHQMRYAEIARIEASARIRKERERLDQKEQARKAADAQDKSEKPAVGDVPKKTQSSPLERANEIKNAAAEGSTKPKIEATNAGAFYN